MLLDELSGCLEADPSRRKPGFGDRLPERVRLQRLVGLELDVRPRLLQCDFCCLHAVQAGQGLLDPVGSDGSDHAVDAHLHLLYLRLALERKYQHTQREPDEEPRMVLP